MIVSFNKALKHLISHISLAKCPTILTVWQYAVRGTQCVIIFPNNIVTAPITDQAQPVHLPVLLLTLPLHPPGEAASVQVPLHISPAVKAAISKNLKEC